MPFRVNTSRGLVGSVALDARMAGQPHTDVSGDCESPAELHLFGYPDKLLVEWGAEPDRPLAQLLLARCRKCPPCLQYRATKWTARAIDEVAGARRSWFGTLTVAPYERFRARLNADHKATATRREPWSSIPAPEQFRLIERELSPEVTKMIKRLRFNTGLPFRYLLVVEAHKDGFPHYHILIHETGDPIRKSKLDTAWRHGFSQWRLVGEDAGAARYVCKYLSKSALTRIRASQRYGQRNAVTFFTEAMEDTADAFRSLPQRPNGSGGVA